MAGQESSHRSAWGAESEPWAPLCGAREGNCNSEQHSNVTLSGAGEEGDLMEITKHLSIERFQFCMGIFPAKRTTNV